MNGAFNRRIWNLREKPQSRDWNTAFSSGDFTQREMMRRSLAYRSYADSADALEPFGFLGESFRVKAGAGMHVVVSEGIGFADGSSDEPDGIDGALGLSDLSPMKPLVLDTEQTITVPTADPSDPRIDIVEVAYDRFVTDTSSRLVLNTGTGQFDPQSVNKTLSVVLDGNTSVNGSAKINYKTGTPASVPVAPSTTTGYVKIAEVKVLALQAAIVDRNILGLRRVTDIGGTDNIISVRCTIDCTTSTWSLASSVLDPVIIAPPGVSVGVFVRKYTSGGFSGLNSVGFCAHGAALPAIARSGTSHLPLSPIDVCVYSGDGTITTAAQLTRPPIWSPMVQSQTNTLSFTSPAITSSYGDIPTGDGSDWDIADFGQSLQVEGFPMQWSSSTQLYAQSMTTNTIEVTLLAVFPTV